MDNYLNMGLYQWQEVCHKYFSHRVVYLIYQRMVDKLVKVRVMADNPHDNLAEYKQSH